MTEEKAGKVIITGGRTYKDKEVLFKVLNDLQEKGGPISEVVQGGASGADALARAWAKQNKIQSGSFTKSTWITTYKAKWPLLGKAAGPIRNMLMCASNTDAAALIAFPGGQGTKNCIVAAKKCGIPVIIVNEHGNYEVQ